MSRQSRAKHSVVVANNYLGGAIQTRVQRKRAVQNFVSWCYKNNHLIDSVKDATLEMVKSYIEVEQAGGLSNATLHNRLASIRRSMQALGANLEKLGITAANVGLLSRDRRGTGEPIPEAEFDAVIHQATDAGETGLVLLLKIQRLLGERGMESLSSIRDLEAFGLEAQALMESGSVAVTRGTKGGRPRTTQVIKSRAQETLEVIRDILLFVRENGGYLIKGSKAGLGPAKGRYHRLAARFGLEGRYTPHALRYAYAVDKIIEMRDAGLNRKEAMSLVAKFLGHGESRNRYITQVYGRTVAHTLAPEKRKKRIDRALENLSKLIAPCVDEGGVASAEN